MSKAQAKDQPSVEELLASIREAIYEDGGETGGADMSAARQSAARSRSGTGEGATQQRAPAGPPRERERPLYEPGHNGAGGAAQAPHGSMRGLRVSLDHDDRGGGRVSAREDDFLHLRQRLTSLVENDRARETRRTMVTSSPEGFSGILGGDVRLEEALARLSRAGRQPETREPVRAAPPPQPAAPRPAAPPPAAPRPAAPPPAAPPPAAPASAAPRRRPLDSAAIEGLAGRELRPAIRDAIDAELQALPPRGHAPQPEPEPYVAPARPVSYSHAAEAVHEDTPPETWEDRSSTPQESHARPGAPASGDAAGGGRAYPSEPPESADRRGPGTTEPRQHKPAAPESRSAPMLAPESAEQASSAFHRLADTLMAQATNGERSIEDLTRELLRPMLKSWLDHNLPKLVERLVREEIERVARHGRPQAR